MWVKDLGTVGGGKGVAGSGLERWGLRNVCGKDVGVELWDGGV